MKLLTRNGHNMYDMASMMQKAIRRGLIRYASYAAYELYGRYSNYAWKRLLIISAEDCYGIITKEIVALKLADDEVNKGKTGYNKECVFLMKAVVLLCMARKNRDACYVACNFIQDNDLLSDEVLEKIGSLSQEELDKMKLLEEKIPDWVFDVHTLKGKYEFRRTELDMIKDEEEALNPHQYSLFDYGDWSEYLDGNASIDADQLEEFQKEQRKKQEEYDTVKNFLKL